MPPGEGERVDLAALALQLIVYVKGSPPADGGHAPFKRGHDFAIYAVSAVSDALDVGRRAAAAGCAAGIGVGDVLVEGDDRFGTPVVIAARLAGVATSGDVLCDPLVASIAPGHAFGDGGTHSLKGIAEPMAAVRPVEVAG